MRERLERARRERPYSLVFAFAMWIPGVLALVYGEAVSRGLTELSVGFMARIMGGALLAASLAMTYGILRNDHLVESFGVLLMAGGATIYGVGVMFGLGLGGAVAGPFALSIVFGSVLRVISLASAADRVAEDG